MTLEGSYAPNRGRAGSAMADEYFLLVCDDVPHHVVLTDPGVRVMDVVQVVRRLTGLSLWRSKVLATEVPAVILAGVPQEDAAAAVSALRDVGARAEARAQPEPDLLKH
jgi:large subunit ribosomal protein L7/L12